MSTLIIISQTAEVVCVCVRIGGGGGQGFSTGIAAQQQEGTIIKVTLLVASHPHNNITAIIRQLENPLIHLYHRLFLWNNKSGFPGSSYLCSILSIIKCRTWHERHWRSRCNLLVTTQGNLSVKPLMRNLSGPWLGSLLELQPAGSARTTRNILMQWLLSWNLQQNVAL